MLFGRVSSCLVFRITCCVEHLHIFKLVSLCSIHMYRRWVVAAHFTLMVIHFLIETSIFAPFEFNIYIEATMLLHLLLLNYMFSILHINKICIWLRRYGQLILINLIVKLWKLIQILRKCVYSNIWCNLLVWVCRHTPVWVYYRRHNNSKTSIRIVLAGCISFWFKLYIMLLVRARLSKNMVLSSIIALFFPLFIIVVDLFFIILTFFILWLFLVIMLLMNTCIH